MATIALTPGRKKKHPIGEHPDRARNGRRKRHRQSIAIFHMGDLMRENPRDLLFGQGAQQAGRDRERRMIRIAAGGKGVRLIALDHIEPWRRNMCPPGKIIHEPSQGGHLRRIDLTRPIHPENDRIGTPIGHEIHGAGENEREDHPASAAQHEADRHEERGQRRDQEPGAKKIVHAAFLARAAAR
jgi:hypothetical protein